MTVRGVEIRPPAIRDEYLDWPITLEDGCTAVVRTTIDDDTLRIVRVIFNGGDREPTSRTFDLLKLGELRQVATRLIANSPHLLLRPGDFEPPRGRPGAIEVDGSTIELTEFTLEELASVRGVWLAHNVSRRLRKGPKKGRNAQNPDHYRDVAIRYIELLDEHGQRVVTAMAEELGYSPNTVSTWVRRAREEGWLTKGIQGKAGGEPGPKLIEWMREQETNQ